MKDPLISVIVPVYKVEPYIRTCLDSLLAQSYPHLEIILVDDGSPDRCGEICDEYGAKDTRIKVVHQENGGVATARNTGLDAASGEWFGFVDSDDWVDPDMFAYLYDLGRRHDADIVQCGLFFEDGTGRSARFVTHAERVTAGGAAGFGELDWSLYSNHNCNKLFRRAAVGKVRFCREYPVGEDLLFNLEVLEQADRVVFGTKAMYHYIQRSDSACHGIPSIQSLLSLRAVLSLASERFRNIPSGHRNFQVAQLRNDLDICSKIARFRLPEYEPVKAQIRSELRRCAREIMFSEEFTFGERCKTALVTRAWTVYQGLLSLRKGWHEP